MRTRNCKIILLFKYVLCIVINFITMVNKTRENINLPLGPLNIECDFFCMYFIDLQVYFRAQYQQFLSEHSNLPSLNDTLDISLQKR